MRVQIRNKKGEKENEVNDEDDNVPGSISLSLPTNIIHHRRTAIPSHILSSSSTTTKSGRNIPGRRKLRRIDNSMFILYRTPLASSLANPSHCIYCADSFRDNPHIITKPIAIDLTSLLLPIPFFAPPPPKTLFSRHCLIPSTTLPTSDDYNSQQGTFHYSKRGIKRSLKSSFQAKLIINQIEVEVIHWLITPASTYTTVVTTATTAITPSLRQIDDTISHFSTTYSTLSYLITDPYSRYVIHALARYYQLISFSKPHPTDPTLRTTHLLRPQIDPTAIVNHHHPHQTQTQGTDGTTMSRSQTEIWTEEEMTTEGSASGYTSNETGATTGAEEDDDEEEGDEIASELDNVSEGGEDDENDEDENEVDVFEGNNGIISHDQSSHNQEGESSSSDGDHDELDEDDEEGEDLTTSIAALPLLVSPPLIPSFFSTSPASRTRLSASPRSPLTPTQQQQQERHHNIHDAEDDDEGDEAEGTSTPRPIRSTAFSQPRSLNHHHHPSSPLSLSSTTPITIPTTATTTISPSSLTRSTRTRMSLAGGSRARIEDAAATERRAEEEDESNIRSPTRIRPVVPIALSIPSTTSSTEGTSTTSDMGDQTSGRRTTTTRRRKKKGGVWAFPRVEFGEWIYG